MALLLALGLSTGGCMFLDGLGLGDTLDGADAPDVFVPGPGDTGADADSDLSPGGDTCGQSVTEADVAAMANQARLDAGLQAVDCDPTLAAAAQAHSRDMCERGYFEHDSPEGETVGDRIRTAGGDFDFAGENIGLGYLSAQSMHEGWMDSDGHRENILNPDFSRIGIGYVECGGEPLWTEVFAN